MINFGENDIICSNLYINKNISPKVLEQRKIEERERSRRNKIGSSFTFICISEDEVPDFLKNFDEKSLKQEEDGIVKVEINMLYFVRVSKLYEIIKNNRYGVLAKELYKNIDKRMITKEDSMEEYRDMLLDKNMFLPHIIQFFNNNKFKSIIKKISIYKNIYTLIARNYRGYNLIGGKDIEYEPPLYTAVRELGEELLLDDGIKVEISEEEICENVQSRRCKVVFYLGMLKYKK